MITTPRIVATEKPFAHANASEAGAAWTCDACQVWWGSQNSARHTTGFLAALPDDLAPSLSWDRYRGWKISMIGVGVCPDCGRPTGRILHSAS